VDFHGRKLRLRSESFHEAGWKTPILIVKDAMRSGSMPESIAATWTIAASWERAITGNTAKRSSNAS
jgi:hypothetical protein